MMVGGIASASQAEDVLCSSGGFACTGAGYGAGSTNTWAEAQYGGHWTTGGHNCTRYAAFRLAANGLGDPGTSWGDAGDWAGSVRGQYGPSAVTSVAAVGSIAQWNPGEGGKGGSGHVAYVEEVTADGIIISEDNYGGGTRRVKLVEGDAEWPSNFLHLRDFLTIESLPTISGSPYVDETLTATDGTTSPLASAVAYQWNRNGTAIPGATGAEYRLTQADIDASITVTTISSLDGFATTVSTSGAVAATAQGFANFGVHLLGTAELDSTLTATLETFTPDVDLDYQWNRNGIKIPYEVRQTYTLGTEDVGAEISVTITGTKAGYATTSVTSQARTVTAREFDGLAIAYATGTARIGQVLTATLANDTPGLVLKWQWNRDGVAIPGANASTYAPTEADLAARLSVTITLTKAGYLPKSVTSAPTAAVTGAEIPFDIFIVHLSGTPKVNSTLTASLQTNTSGADLVWQWNRNGSPIALATTNTYTLKQADIGAAITVSVTGTKVGYSTTTQTSSAVTVTAADISMSGVTISGTARVDSTVYSNVTVYTSDVYVSYQWKRNGYFINGAQGSGYTLTAADVGASITVTVTASRAGYVTTSTTSGAVTGTAGTILAFIAYASGTPQVDSTLTASAGTSTSGVSVSYQWKRNGAVVGTSQTYRLTQADIGTSIAVTITGSKAGYATTSSTSAAKTVTALAFGQRTASITGTVRERYTVTANYTINVSGATVTYQWYRDGVLKSGATGKTFAIGTADIGKKLSVAVTFTKSGYQTTTIRSPQTVAVKGYSS